MTLKLVPAIPRPAPTKWCETEISKRMIFRGLATLVCAPKLFTPGFNEIPANDRDHIRW